MLTFAHIGDTHIVDPRMPNARDLLAIVAQIEMECAKLLDFVVLPGDVADNGLPLQYALVATALKMLSMPVHAIPGDHDMEPGDLAGFHDGLRLGRLPKAVVGGGVCCLFLDISGPGDGGPDFRLGDEQFAWLDGELAAARLRGNTVAIFMHSYPADLRGEGEAERVAALIANNDVALVDLGHTHYNELANDGRTIFAATRSTGQIEEGPVGYALTTIDVGRVSWRFKLLDEPFPYVMITTPADHRLLRGPDQIASGTIDVHALVFGADDLRSVELRLDDGSWLPMTTAAGEQIWRRRIDAPDRERFTLAVRAIATTGRPGMHSITVAGRGFRVREHRPTASDEASVGAWPENGIFGTQLGPNRNAKPVGGKPS